MLSSNVSPLKKVDALNECIDLVCNGYRVMHETVLAGKSIIRLRHRSNRRMLTVVLDDKEFIIREDGRVIKHVPVIP